MNRMTTEEKCAANIAKKSTTFLELKMKLELNNLNLYNIDILRRVFNQIINNKLYYELKNDIETKIDELYPQDYVTDLVNEVIWNEIPKNKKKDRDLSRFEIFLCNIWLKKHEKIWRKYHSKFKNEQDVF